VKGKTMSDERKQLCDGLRELADYLESNEAVPLPYLGQFDAFVCNKDELADAARAMGSCDKVASGAWFYLRKSFSAGIQLHVNINRDIVCERVQTGTKKVKMPAQQALPEREVDEPVYEYHCPDSIMRPM
jgi:hypothetical protein